MAHWRQAMSASRDWPDGAAALDQQAAADAHEVSMSNKPSTELLRGTAELLGLAVLHLGN